MTPPQDAALAAVQEPARTVTVVGQGKVSLVPDVARINVGAEERAATVSEAKASDERSEKQVRFMPLLGGS